MPSVKREAFGGYRTMRESNTEIGPSPGYKYFRSVRRPTPYLLYSAFKAMSNQSDVDYRMKTLVIEDVVPRWQTLENWKRLVPTPGRQSPSKMLPIQLSMAQYVRVSNMKAAVESSELTSKRKYHVNVRHLNFFLTPIPPPNRIRTQTYSPMFVDAFVSCDEKNNGYLCNPFSTIRIRLVPRLGLEPSCHQNGDILHPKSGSRCAATPTGSARGRGSKELPKVQSDRVILDGRSLPEF
jgi:hypothetical protein